MTSAVLRRFAEPLHILIRQHYKAKDLAQVLYFHMGERLDAIAPDQTDFDAVVFSLVLWADQHGRMFELASAVAKSRPRVNDFNGLVAEMEKAGEMVATGIDGLGRAGSTTYPFPTPTLNHVASHGESVPDELVALFRAYERIRRVMDRSPMRRATSHGMAEQIKAFPIDVLGLAERLHLSNFIGERLAAILALEKSPDPNYFRWLSERPFVESRFIGLRATYALEEAAKRLPLDRLDMLAEVLNQTADWLKKRDDDDYEELSKVLSIALKTIAKRSSSIRG